MKNDRKVWRMIGSHRRTHVRTRTVAATQVATQVRCRGVLYHDVVNQSLGVQGAFACLVLRLHLRLHLRPHLWTHLRQYLHWYLCLLLRLLHTYELCVAAGRVCVQSVSIEPRDAAAQAFATERVGGTPMLTDNDPDELMHWLRKRTGDGEQPQLPSARDENLQVIFIMLDIKLSRKILELDSNQQAWLHYKCIAMTSAHRRRSIRRSVRRSVRRYGRGCHCTSVKKLHPHVESVLKSAPPRVAPPRSCPPCAPPQPPPQPVFRLCIVQSKVRVPTVRH